MSDELDYMRAYCSNWYRKHFGIQYDPTPWWDKWQIIGTFKALKQEEIKNEQVCDFGQNEQETET